MEKQKYKIKILAISIAVAIILFTLINKVVAYFTTYTESSGGWVIHIDEVATEINQEDRTNSKDITINNIGGKPCYVRVKIFVLEGTAFTISSSDKWQYGEDGYIYYSEILQSGETTERLIMNYADKNKKAIVISEATDVMYDELGEQYNDWNLQYNYTI